MRRVRAHSDQDKEAVLTVLAEFFTVKNGRLSNARLSREWVSANEAHIKRVSAGSRGGKAKALNRNDNGSSNVKAKPKQPEPEPEPESETRNVSTTDEAGRCKLGKCDGRGAIRASGGRILRCCDCEIGLRRGREFAAGRQSEERAAAEKPADLGAQSPRGNRDGPTKLELPPGLALGSPQEPKTGGA